MEQIKLEIAVNESDSARFEVTYIMSSGLNYLDYDESFNMLDTMIYNGYKKRFRPLFINRLDKYQGVCEYMSREADFDPELCI
jgi:hypothetical protein